MSHNCTIHTIHWLEHDEEAAAASADDEDHLGSKSNTPAARESDTDNEAEHNKILENNETTNNAALR